MHKPFLYVLVTSCIIASSAYGQEISETLAKPLRATLNSNLKPTQLEFCVADAITRVGGAIPIPIHDENNRTLMLGYGHTPKLVVSLEPTAGGTTIKVYTKAGDVDERFVGYLKESCHL